MHISSNMESFTTKLLIGSVFAFKSFSSVAEKKTALYALKTIFHLKNIAGQKSASYIGYRNIVSSK